VPDDKQGSLALQASPSRVKTGSCLTQTLSIDELIDEAKFRCEFFCSDSRPAKAARRVIRLGAPSSWRSW
jgi:hypothetical protein